LIDKLDSRVPSMTPFTPRFEKVIFQLRCGSIPPFRPSKFYRFVGDLRKDFDLDAILHLEYKFGEGTHKIEIIDAGKKTLREMEEIISSVFVVDPSTLEFMRVDFAADVEGIPVSWFQDNTTFQYKRFSSRIEKAMETELEFIGMNSAQAQSLYAGRKPNCIRIYNKIAELQRQWRKIVNNYHRFNRGMAEFDMTDEQRYYGQRIPPTFEQFCRIEGFEYSEGLILTRIERQIGGDRFPPELSTIGDLRRVPDFNPFSGLRLISTNGVSELPPPTEVGIRDWLAAKGLQELKKEMGGAQPAFAFVRKHGRGNGSRILDSLVPHLPKAERYLTSESLFQTYRDTTRKQVPAC
jgi:hypothetical protein